MDSDNEREALSFVTGLLLGAMIGAGVAMLTAPQPGRKTRKKIRKTARRFRGTATDRLDELAGEIKERVDDAVVAAKERVPTR